MSVRLTFPVVSSFYDEVSGDFNKNYICFISVTDEIPNFVEPLLSK